MCVLQAHDGCLLHSKVIMELTGEQPSRSRDTGCFKSLGSGTRSACKSLCNCGQVSDPPCSHPQDGRLASSSASFLSGAWPWLPYTCYRRLCSPPQAHLLEHMSSTTSQRFGGFALSPQHTTCSPKRRFAGKKQGGREPEGGAVAPVVALFSRAGRFSEDPRKPGRADGRFCSILGPSQFSKPCLFAESSQALPLGPPRLLGPFTHLQSCVPLGLPWARGGGSQPVVSGT